MRSSRGSGTYPAEGGTRYPVFRRSRGCSSDNSSRPPRRRWRVRSVPRARTREAIVSRRTEGEKDPGHRCPSVETRSGYRTRRDLAEDVARRPRRRARRRSGEGALRLAVSQGPVPSGEQHAATDDAGTNHGRATAHSHPPRRSEGARGILQSPNASRLQADRPEEKGREGDLEERGD